MSRAIEMQNVVLILGALILLGGAFYAGTKVQRVKAFLASRNRPDVTNVDPQKFPGLSADELVEQALAAERLGNWREAIERLLVAKRRDVSYRDILFHAGKLCYDRGDFDSADRLLERAIAYGDQVDVANYLRGLIAIGRNDLPAAEVFFEAAIKAEPFTPGYYYYLGETLRREHRARDAIERYEQAASRTVNEQDAELCRFKARMAKAETADRSELENEIEKKRNTGPLPVEWQLTDAALKIQTGQFDEAVHIIQQARASDEPRLRAVFGSCIADMLFTEAASNHPAIAEACRVSASTGPLVIPSPSASP
jgi:tetratricopeptide (TPR) repeat protein